VVYGVLVACDDDSVSVINERVARTSPCRARSEKLIGMILLIINLAGNPPGSGLVSPMANELLTNDKLS
jgi:hypothetical protein